MRKPNCVPATLGQEVPNSFFFSFLFLLISDSNLYRSRRGVSYRISVCFHNHGPSPSPNPSPNPNPYETPAGVSLNDVTGVKWGEMVENTS